MVNPIQIRNMIAGMGGAGGLLAANESEAGGSSKLSAVLALMNKMSKGKYRSQNNLGKVHKQLVDLNTDFKEFAYQPGSGKYGTIRLRFPDGNLMETQIASSSHVLADDQLVARLRGARAQIDPNFKADEGSNYSKWTKVGAGSLAAGGAHASEGNEQYNPFAQYINPPNDIQQSYINSTNGNGYEGMSPEREAYYRQQNNNDMLESGRDLFTSTAEGLLSAPVGVAEAVVGLPMDVYGAIKGGKAAYDAEEGKGWDAFTDEFNDTPMTTQWIQGHTNKVLPEWMQGNTAGGWSRLGGEFIAPGGYFKAAKRIGLGKDQIVGAGLLGGGMNIE